MNEWIKELAQQSGWDTHHAQFDTRIEKFAELIVQECAKLVEDNMDPQNAWITPAYIKEHFGVKE